MWRGNLVDTRYIVIQPRPERTTPLTKSELPNTEMTQRESNEFQGPVIQASTNTWRRYLVNIYNIVIQPRPGRITSLTNPISQTQQ